MAAEVKGVVGLDKLDGRPVILSLSGGKDSTAMAIALQAHGIAFTPVFLDTGWETPWTYEHIRGELADRFGPLVERRAEIELPEDLEGVARGFEERLGHYSAMVRLCLKKGMFPSRQRRWCTQILKVFTMRDYLAGLNGEHVNAVGIRREEGKNTKGRPGSRWEAPVWGHTQTYGTDTWHPIVEWTEQDVIDAHHAAGLTPNRHYLHGSERVGCMPCIHARKSEIAALGRYHPERVELLADLERVIGDLAEQRATAQGTTLEERGHHRPAWFQSRKDDRRWVPCPDCSRSVLDDDDCYALGPDDDACETCGGSGRVRTKGSKIKDMWPIGRVVLWAHTDRKGELFTPDPEDEGYMKWGLCEVRAEMESTPNQGWRDRKTLLKRLVGGAIVKLRKAKHPETADPLLALRTIWDSWAQLGPDAEPMVAYWLEAAIPSPREIKKRKHTEPPMNYVSHIRSNLKVGCDLDLGPKVLIVGRNGIGKSSIVGALELALTCRVSDVAGKESVATPVDLLSLAPGRSGTLWAEAKLSNDTVARVDMAIKTAGHGSKPKPQSPYPALVTDRVHPIRDLDDALASPEKAQKFLLANSGMAVTHQDVLQRIPQKYVERYEALARLNARDPVSNLLFVAARANENRRKAANAAKTTEASVETAAQGLAPAPTAIQVDEARTQEANARLALAQATQALQAQTLADSAQRQLGPIETKIAELRAYDASRYERGLAMLGLLKVAHERQLEVCPFCDQNVPHPLEGEVACWKDKHNALHPVVHGQLAPPAAYQDLQKLEQEAARLKHTISLAPAERTGQPAVDRLDAALQIAVKRYQDLLQLQAAWAAHRRTIDAGVDQQDEATEWEKLEDHAKNAMRSLVTAAADAFSEKVTKFLPKGDTFGLRLAEGDRKVVQYGLLREGPDGEAVLHTALSGAEWARVTAALAAVLSVGTPLAVIMPQERAFDPATLREVMAALTDAPCQVILTSPVKPKGRTPAGWTLIDLDALEKGSEYRSAVEAMIEATSDDEEGKPVSAEEVAETEAIVRQAMAGDLAGAAKALETTVHHDADGAIAAAVAIATDDDAQLAKLQSVIESVPVDDVQPEPVTTVQDPQTFSAAEL